MFVNKSSIAQAFWSQIVDRIHSHASTSQTQSLHVPPLCPTQAQDSLLSHSIQTQRVNPLLVNHNEALSTAWWANLLFQFNDLLHTLIDELTLGSKKCFTFLSSRVEKSSVDFTVNLSK